MNRLLLTLTLLALSQLNLLAIKGEDLANRKLNTVNWGEALEGDSSKEFNAASLAGKIVIVEEFGIKTEACLIRLKELVRLAKKLERSGAKAVIVAIHRQRDVPDADILEALKKARVTFAVRKNGYLPATIGDMPHAALFHPDGSMTWHGDSTKRDFDRALDQLLKATEEE